MPSLSCRSYLPVAWKDTSHVVKQPVLLAWHCNHFCPLVLVQQLQQQPVNNSQRDTLGALFLALLFLLFSFSAPSH